MLLLALSHPAFKDKEEHPVHIAVDTIVASLRSNHNDYYLFRGEPAGYHMEMVRAFAKSIGKPYRIHIETDVDKRWNELLHHKVDIVVGSSKDDSILQKHKAKIIKSMPLEKSTESIWVVAKHNRSLLEAVNVWMAHYRNTTECAIREHTYFVARSNFPGRTQYASLSPYDDLIKSHAKLIGWDWRLLASLVYQESKFHPEARSPRGAYGLMQITPVTAQFLKVDNIDSPEHNMEAGIKLIRYLQRSIVLESASPADSIRFVLAAYNAGPNRLKDCRQFAQSQGKNPNIWKDVAAVIPLMKHEVFYDSEDIRLGSFKGTETLNYVEQIMDRFEHYKVLLDP